MYLGHRSGRRDRKTLARRITTGEANYDQRLAGLRLKYQYGQSLKDWLDRICATPGTRARIGLRGQPKKAADPLAIVGGEASEEMMDGWTCPNCGSDEGSPADYDWGAEPGYRLVGTTPPTLNGAPEKRRFPRLRIC